MSAIIASRAHLIGFSGTDSVLRPINKFAKSVFLDKLILQKTSGEFVAIPYVGDK
jgi:hypothetical protein